VVRKGGVEPPRRKAQDPKSSASTNSATPATAQRILRDGASVEPALGEIFNEAKDHPRRGSIYVVGVANLGFYLFVY
jgi:hypothetical protein